MVSVSIIVALALQIPLASAHEEVDDAIAAINGGCELYKIILASYGLSEDSGCAPVISSLICDNQCPPSDFSETTCTEIPAYMINQLSNVCNTQPACELDTFSSPCTHYYIQNNLTYPIINSTCLPTKPIEPEPTVGRLCGDRSIFGNPAPESTPTLIQITSFTNDMNGVWGEAFGNSTNTTDVFWSGPGHHGSHWNLGTRRAGYLDAYKTSEFGFIFKTNPQEDGSSPPFIMFDYAVTGPDPTLQVFPLNAHFLKSRSGLRFKVNGTVHMDAVGSPSTVKGGWRADLEYDSFYNVSWEFKVGDESFDGELKADISAILLSNSTIVFMTNATGSESSTGFIAQYHTAIIVFLIVVCAVIIIYSSKKGFLDPRGWYTAIKKKVRDPDYDDFVGGKNAESYSIELQRYGVRDDRFAFLGDEEDEMDEIVFENSRETDEITIVE